MCCIFQRWNAQTQSRAREGLQKPFEHQKCHQLWLFLKHCHHLTNIPQAKNIFTQKDSLVWVSMTFALDFGFPDLDSMWLEGIFDEVHGIAATHSASFEAPWKCEKLWKFKRHNVSCGHRWPPSKRIPSQTWDPGSGSGGGSAAVAVAVMTKT